MKSFDYYNIMSVDNRNELQERWNCLEAFLKNCENDNNPPSVSDINEKSLKHCLEYAFSWDTSPEGDRFWSDIYDTLCEEEDYEEEDDEEENDYL